MATFTASVPLDIRWLGYELAGPAGTEHRISDALYEEFQAAFGDLIPGLTWTDADETDSFATLPVAQADVTGLTAALAAKVDTTSLSSYVPKSGATMTGTLTGPAFAATGRPWFDVKAFGATGDGATDDRAAIQTALTSAAAVRGTVFIPEGTYLISGSALTVSSGVTVQGAGAGSLLKLDSAAYGIVGSGTLGTLRTASANVTVGATTVGLSSGGSDFTADGGLWLQSEAQALGAVGHKKGEVHVVSSVSSNTITLAGNALDIYNTSDSAKAGAVSFISDVTIRDLALYNTVYTTAISTPTTALIRFNWGRRITVENVRMRENNGGGVNFYNTIDSVIRGCFVEKLRDDTANSIYGYGYSLNGGSRNNVLTGSVARECRHGVTLDTSNFGDTPDYGVIRATTIVGNTFADCSHIGLDTHEDCDGVAITGNTIVGCDYGGIQLRGYNSTVSGNAVHGVRGAGIYVRNSAKYTLISGNTVEGTKVSPDDGLGYGIYVDSKICLVVANRVNNSAKDGIRTDSNASQEIGIVTNMVINPGLHTLSDGIHIASGGDRLVVLGNMAVERSSSGTMRYGLYFSSAHTVADGRTVTVGNIVGTGTSGTLGYAGSGNPQGLGNGDTRARGAVLQAIGSTGSIAASATSTVTVGFGTTFQATDYTVVATAEDSTGNLAVQSITSKANSSVTVRVKNNDGSNARSGNVHVIAIRNL